MALAGKFVALFVIFVAIVLYTKVKPLFDYPEIPQVDDIWWGPGDVSSKIDTSIKPFKINLTDDVS